MEQLIDKLIDKGIAVTIALILVLFMVRDVNKALRELLTADALTNQLLNDFKRKFDEISKKLDDIKLLLVSRGEK